MNLFARSVERDGSRPLRFAGDYLATTSNNDKANADYTVITLIFTDSGKAL
jgi:hypothetical protein